MWPQRNRKRKQASELSHADGSADFYQRFILMRGMPGLVFRVPGNEKLIFRVIDFLGAGPEARTGIGPKTDTTPTRHDTTLIQSITLVGHSVNHSGDLKPLPTR